MRRTSSALLATLLFSLTTPVATASAPQPAPDETPPICLPYLQAMSDGWVSDHNYLVGVIAEREAVMWRQAVRIEHLRSANEVKRETIRHLRREIRRLRAQG